MPKRTLTDGPLAAEIASAAAGRPISWYREETEGARSVLWLWPSEIGDDDTEGQRAAAIGIIESRDSVTLVDGRRGIIYYADYMDGALRTAGYFLSTRPAVAEAGLKSEIQGAPVVMTMPEIVAITGCSAKTKAIGGLGGIGAYAYDFFRGPKGDAWLARLAD